MDVSIILKDLNPTLDDRLPHGSIKDIAEETGLTKPTIYKVLRGGDVSLKRKKAIYEAAYHLLLKNGQEITDTLKVLPEPKVAFGAVA